MRCYERILPSITKLFKVNTYTDGPSGSGSVDSTAALEEVNRFGVSQTNCPCDNSAECVDRSPVKLPNVRLVSANFFLDNTTAEDQQVTHMHTQFGQFLDHDLVLTPEEDEHECCEEFGARPSCFPIQIPENDYFYQSSILRERGHDQRCLDHSRSVGCCSDGFESSNHEQLNGITAFIDASNVYGSSEFQSNKLRVKDGSGRLKVDQNTLLPILQQSPSESDQGRTAGDSRAAEMPGLATMHTVFVREHNRICDALKLHPDIDDSWEDEDFYQNARRILIAQMQKIVYNEYLPVIFGRNEIYRWDLTLSQNTKYYSYVDPTHVNSFGAAAFRFGHTMIQGLIKMFEDILSTDTFNIYELGQNFFNLTNYELRDGEGMELILIGLMRQKAQSNDRHVSEELTNKLFANSNPFMTSTGANITGVGGDLVSRNIQRGRDHGLPSYAAFYKHLHQPADISVLDCWSNKPKDISLENWNLLKRIYNHPHHIDLFVGGLAEEPYSGGLTGRTFQAIIGQTFRNLKHGDRFFFTHEGNMDSNEFDQIMGRTFGDIICDNSPFISGVLENVFLIDSPVKKCRKNMMNIKAFNISRVITG